MFSHGKISQCSTTYQIPVNSKLLEKQIALAFLTVQIRCRTSSKTYLKCNFKLLYSYTRNKMTFRYLLQRINQLVLHSRLPMDNLINKLRADVLKNATILVVDLLLQQ